MACGATVVGSNGSSIPELPGDAAILADPASPGAHIEAIAGLLTDSRTREDLSRKGRVRSRMFTWSNCAAELHGHFESML